MLLRIAAAFLALAGTALAQDGTNYVEVTGQNFDSTVVASKPVVLAVGKQTWSRSTEMNKALFDAALAMPDVRFAHAEASDVPTLLGAIRAQYLPMYFLLDRHCDNVLIAPGIMNKDELVAFVNEGKAACKTSSTVKGNHALVSRSELLEALGIDDRVAVGIGVALAIDKPLAGIVVGAPDEMEKLMQPHVISSDKPLLVAGVAGGSPAAEAGIHTGDRVTEINGVPVDGSTMKQIGERLHIDKVGDELSLTVVASSGGKPVTYHLRAAEYVPDYDSLR